MSEAYKAALADMEKLDALYKNNPDQDTFVGGDYFWEHKDTIKRALVALTTQPQSKEVEKLLMDMRCEVVYTHVATMSIPLYERIKAALASVPKQREIEADKWEDVHLRVYKDDQYSGPGHKCISYKGVIYRPDNKREIED